ncbi:DUF3261 domain-containing protein [Roseateles chitinivorans]|uniref:DUF3261 domain-containing protein n=1 Tax=Roseateles chitinivorans TaxID=2917965 RepID=UPI003D67281D
MKRREVLALAVLAGTALVGCASPRPAVVAVALPPLRVPPSALGAVRHALSQRLSVYRLDRPDARPQQVEVQLQLDADGLLLAGFAFGQRVLLMQWDGRSLQVQRSPYLPAEVDTDRMLRDLCLVFWPAEAVRAALPPGWTWTGSEGGWELREVGSLRLSVRRPDAGTVEIVNPSEGYRLVIESQPLETP